MVSIKCIYHKLTNRCVSNGILVAEILHNYQPKTVDLGKFIDGQSIKVKLHNWNMIQEVFNSIVFYSP